MDEMARGVATAALALQSVLLQALVHKGVLTREDALGIVERSLAAADHVPSARAAGKVAEVTMDCLNGVREGLEEMPTTQ
jgi:hypothetical protein